MKKNIHYYIHQLLLSQRSYKLKDNLYMDYIAAGPVIMSVMLVLMTSRLITGNLVPITPFQWTALAVLMLLCWLTFDLGGLGYPELFKHRILASIQPQTTLDYMELLPEPYRSRLTRYVSRFQYDVPAEHLTDVLHRHVRGRKVLDEGAVYWRIVRQKYGYRLKPHVRGRQRMRKVKAIKSNGGYIY